MRTNPGGILTPDEVVGRDELIADLWDRLDRYSVQMTAERRMGKTSVVNKMVAQHPDNVTAFYWDLEDVGSSEALVQEIFAEVYKVLGGFEQWQGKFQQFLKNWGLGGEKMVGVSLPKPEMTWHQHLKGIVEDLYSQLDEQDRLLFCFDELPLAINNIRENQGARVAMHVLDTLRSIRQEYRQIRMIYTGSIGLHHVISELNKQGYRNAPTNDMPRIDIEPLTETDAWELAQDLLIGEEIAVEGLEEVSKAIAMAVDCIPFYIHHSVASLKELRLKVVTVEQVEKMLQVVVEQSDAWKMNYYEDRVSEYYGEHKNLALMVLDKLCTRESLSVEDLRSQVLTPSDGSVISQDSKEILRSTLKLLEQDHYTRRNSAGEYQFRFKLIKRYWQQQRG